MSDIEVKQSPTGIRDPRIRKSLLVTAWLSFVSEVAIIATGGAVRLTGSGLGCPTWPMCTSESLTPTAEMGVHGMIEFGNRMMSGVVGLLALIVVILVWKLRRQRRDLFVLAVIVLAGVILQGVVGGISVRTGLNPAIVGFHYIASLILVCICAAFLYRAYSPLGKRELVVPKWFAVSIHITSVVVALTVLAGIFTTASGPHSGDDEVVRQGFDAGALAHIHSWPGYLLLVLTVVLTVIAFTKEFAPKSWLAVFLSLLIIQVFVGVWQSREGLPILLVGIHMVLATVTAATYVIVIMDLKRVQVET